MRWRIARTSSWRPSGGAAAADRTVVLKPSDTTPAISMTLGGLAQELLRRVVLNVVGGERETGRAAVAHSTPQMVGQRGLGAWIKQVASFPEPR